MQVPPASVTATSAQWERETVPDEGSSEYQRQTRGHQPQDRTLLMFAIARSERQCTNERYPYGEYAMCVLFGR